MSRRPHPAVLAGALALMVALWSFNFIFGKVALRYWPALALASFRLILAALIMLPVYLALRPRRAALQAPENPPATVSSGDDLWTFAQLGFFGVFLNQVCFTVGLNYTTVGHSALLIGMGPVFILLFARLQGLEALTLRKVLGMVVAFAGVILLVSEHGLSLRSGTLRGDLITLVGTLAFSLYTVLGKKVAAKYDSISMNAGNYCFGALLVLPLAVREGLRLTRTAGWGAIPWQGWAALGYMAAFASVLAYVLYFWVLRHMTATRLGALAYLHPLLTTGMGIALLGEKFTGHLLVGAALVLGGVYGIESGPREDQPEGNNLA